MHAALDFGAVRLHLFTVIPGRDGDARRLAAGLNRHQPRFLACEVDPRHALAAKQAVAGARNAEPPFLARLAAGEVARCHGGDARADPFVTAARFARDEEATLLPLLPSSPEPAFMERRRLRHRVERLPPGEDEADTLAGVERAVRAAEPHGSRRMDEDDAAAARLADLLFEQDLGRVAAILTPARGPAILAGLKARAPPRPSSLEPPRETARAEVAHVEPYPAYR